MAVGVGFMAAGYFFLNSSEEITEAVEEFEKEKKMSYFQKVFNCFSLWRGSNIFCFLRSAWIIKP